MLIQSKIERKGGSVITLGPNTYHFKPKPPDDMRHTCEVTDEDDVQALIAIKEGYCFAKKLEKASAASVKQSGAQEPAPQQTQQTNQVQAEQPQTEQTNDDAGSAGANAGTAGGGDDQGQADGNAGNAGNAKENAKPLHVDQRGNGNWFVKRGHKYVSEGFKTKGEAEAKMNEMQGSGSENE